MTFQSAGSRLGRGPSLRARLTTALLFIGLGCSTGWAATASGSAPSAKQGDQIFHQRCIVCHNKQPEDTTPFGPPNLYKAFRGHQLTTVQAETIITNGKGQMPSFKTILTRPEIRSVIAYLRSR